MGDPIEVRLAAVNIEDRILHLVRSDVNIEGRTFRSASAKRKASGRPSGKGPKKGLRTRKGSLKKFGKSQNKKRGKSSGTKAGKNGKKKR
ncbi:MAG: hypothetical protein JKX97_04870 [Candidatus Lindowbacteria bacterium]|nr:hypothetical protein [Candidatus Lindowbacteria bacterium]